jgi:hypothetical protein
VRRSFVRLVLTSHTVADDCHRDAILLEKEEEKRSPIPILKDSRMLRLLLNTHQVFVEYQYY